MIVDFDGCKLRVKPTPITNLDNKPILDCGDQLHGELSEPLTDGNPCDVSDGKAEECHHVPDDDTAFIRPCCWGQQNQVDDIHGDGNTGQDFRCTDANNSVLLDDWHGGLWNNLVVGWLTKCVLQLLLDLPPALDGHTKYEIVLSYIISEPVNYRSGILELDHCYL